MVDSAKVNDWLQVVGMFGVIASLIFVGMQMKQTHEIALSSTYQARSDAAMEFLVSGVDSLTLLSAYAKTYSGRSGDLTMQEAIAMELYLGANMVQFENNHLQYKMGFLSEEHWQRNIAELECLFALPEHRQMMRYAAFRDSFQEVIDVIINEASNSRVDCWGSDWTYPVAE